MKKFKVIKKLFSRFFLWFFLVFSSESTAADSEQPQPLKVRKRNVNVTKSSISTIKRIDTIKQIDTNKWMSYLAGDESISKFSIPGTHGSGTFNNVYLNSNAQHQNHDFRTQLGDGIRFFDIRCHYFENAFILHNDSIYSDHYFNEAQNINSNVFKKTPKNLRLMSTYPRKNLQFNEVLDVCNNFLKDNPSECILMSIKQENDSETPEQSFEETFVKEYLNQYKNLFYIEESIPILSEVRGKIILLRRFEATNMPLGIDLTDYPWDHHHNHKFSCINANNITYHVQDMHNFGLYKRKMKTVDSGLNDKFSQIKFQITKATQGNINDLYFNFTNGFMNPSRTEESFSIPPKKVAKAINQRLNDYLDKIYTCERTRIGIMAMDFYNNIPDLIEKIIRINFNIVKSYKGENTEIFTGLSYNIIQKKTGRPLTINSSGLVTVSKKHGLYDVKTQWYLVVREDNSYNIIQKKRGLPLILNSSDLVKVSKKHDLDDATAQWLLIARKNGYYNIIQEETNNSLDTKTSGSVIISANMLHNNSFTQQWRFLKVT